MKIIDKLKQYFAEEKPVPVESVSKKKLAEWIDSTANRNFEDVKPKIEDVLSQLFDTRSRMVKKLNILKEAQLHNPNIPEKEKQVMEGNRSAFISQHLNFANNINYPSKLNIHKTSEFCTDFEDALLRLAKSTAKGNAVVSQFFADKISDINKTVKEMGDGISHIKEILEESDIDVKNLGNLRKTAAELKNKSKLLDDYEQELSVYQTKLANSNQYKDKLMKKMEELKLTDGYSEFKQANKTKEEQWNALRSVESEISETFSSISKPLRKYEYTAAENVELIKAYSENPVSALAEDEKLTIIKILSKLGEAVRSGSLGVKDEDKIITKIESFDASVLSGLRQRYLNAKSSIKTIDNKIRSSSVLQELNDLNYKVEHTDTQISLMHDKIEQTKKSIEKIDLNILKEKIEKSAPNILGVEVSISDTTKNNKKNNEQANN